MVNAPGSITTLGSQKIQSSRTPLAPMARRKNDHLARFGPIYLASAVRSDAFKRQEQAPVAATDLLVEDGRLASSDDFNQLSRRATRCLTASTAGTGLPHYSRRCGVPRRASRGQWRGQIRGSKITPRSQARNGSQAAGSGNG